MIPMSTTYCMYVVNGFHRAIEDHILNVPNNFYMQLPAQELEPAVELGHWLCKYRETIFT